MKSVITIGGGFAGLAASALVAKAGFKSILVEKNESVGGRARAFKAADFTFDMGPSWYWMPDIFEKYFGYFSQRPEDFFRLKKLDPAFRIFFPDQIVDVPGEAHEVYELFASQQGTM